MHDIKFIKENPDNFEKSLKKRNCIVDSKKLIDRASFVRSFVRCWFARSFIQ